MYFKLSKLIGFTFDISLVPKLLFEMVETIKQNKKSSYRCIQNAFSMISLCWQDCPDRNKECSAPPQNKPSGPHYLPAQAL